MPQPEFFEIQEIIQIIGDARQGDSLLIPVLSREQTRVIQRSLHESYPYSRFIIIAELDGYDLNCRITIAYHSL